MFNNMTWNEVHDTYSGKSFHLILSFLIQHYVTSESFHFLSRNFSTSLSAICIMDLGIRS